MAHGGPQEAIRAALPSPKRPLGRSLADFSIDGAITPHGLHAAEELLLECAARGEPCRISSACPESATPENTVRGSFLRFLLLGGDENAPVHEKGIMLHGAFVEGTIDLESAKDIRSFLLWYCRVSHPIIGRNANFDDIALQFCRVGELNFASASISGDAFLSGSLAQGGTSFAGSKIGGGVFLNDWFEAEGGVRFTGAEINGNLECHGGKLKNSCGAALNCDGAKVAGNAILRDGFSAEGEVRFVGAKIGGLLDCTAGKFKNPENYALVCDGIEVSGNVLLQAEFESEGEVRFVGANIRGQFNSDGASFKNPTGYALNCENVCISASVFLRNGLRANGSVRFRNAEIGGSMGLDGGTFTVSTQSPREDPKEMLGADNAVDLIQARIAGILWLGPPRRRAVPAAEVRGAMNFQSTTVGALYDDPTAWPRPTVDHSGKSLSSFIWLDGFTYGSFRAGAPADWKTRIDWLMRQPIHHIGGSFRPQPFEQCIKVLREMGHDADARRIAMLKQSLLHKRKKFWRQPFAWAIGSLWGLSCGYGYRPHRLFISLLALWFICGFLYHLGAVHGGFAPKDAQVWTNQAYNQACDKSWTDCANLKADGGGKVSEIIAFNPFTYSADMLLPAIDLGQRSAWTPMWREIKVTLPEAGEVTLPKWSLRAAAWAENILGVSGVILIGAILSGIIKRD